MPEPQSLARQPLLEIGGLLDGRYKVIQLVANGGMGTVYLAEHILIKRRVAIKVLHRELANDGAMVKRFMNEALAAGTLGHPNIVEATDMGFTPDCVPYIVYEYLEGSVLTDEIYRNHGLPVSRALKIASQIASALDAAHLACIVHLDLKPENVFLTDRHGFADHVKVLDFGIAQFSGPDVEHTQRGLVIGTPQYMSPEQVIDPNNVDHRADIYALGLVLYEMLTARRPFKCDDPRVLLHRICNEDPPPLAQRNVSWDLEQMIFERLLAKDPERRFTTMRQVALQLQVFLDAIGSGDVPSARSFAAPESLVSIVAPPPPAELEPFVEVTELPPPERQWATGLFALAVVAGLAGGGLNVTATRFASAPNDAAVKALLEANAEQLSTTLAASARAARLRVDGIATSPILRTAIEAGAVTVETLDEAGFVSAPGEIFELFLLRDAKATSVLRIPAAAPAIYTAIESSETTVHSTGTDISVIAGAPVLKHDSAVGGTIALATTIDLTPIKRRLTDKVFEARLVGLDEPVILTRGPRLFEPGKTMSMRITTTPNLDVGGLTLQATLRSAGGGLMKTASHACFGVGGALLLASLISRRRR